MEYIEKIGGYIADVPNIEFVRCDGKAFSYDRVQQANLSHENESIEINGGQRSFALANISTTQKIELSFESSEFSMDLFEIGHATNVKDEQEYSLVESKRYEIEAGTKAVIPYIVDAESVFINNLKPTTDATVASGYYRVEVDETAKESTVYFNEDDFDEGDIVRVAYKRLIKSTHVISVGTNSTSSVGSLTVTYPVYSAGTDCTESSVKGYLYLHLYKVRCSVPPGMDNSYKTAATPGLTFTMINPKRADKKCFDIVYEDADGSFSDHYATFGINALTAELMANSPDEDDSYMTYIPAFELSDDNELSVSSDGPNETYTLSNDEELIWSGDGK